MDLKLFNILKKTFSADDRNKPDIKKLAEFLTLEDAIRISKSVYGWTNAKKSFAKRTEGKTKKQISKMMSEVSKCRKK